MVLQTNACTEERLYQEILCHPHLYISSSKEFLLKCPDIGGALICTYFPLMKPKHSGKFKIVQQSCAMSTHFARQSSGIITLTWCYSPICNQLLDPIKNVKSRYFRNIQRALCVFLCSMFQSLLHWSDMVLASFTIISPEIRSRKSCSLNECYKTEIPAGKA